MLAGMCAAPHNAAVGRYTHLLVAIYGSCNVIIIVSRKLCEDATRIPKSLGRLYWLNTSEPLPQSLLPLNLARSGYHDRFRKCAV